MKNHATISVDEDIITWESSHDKCTFTRSLTSLESTSPSSPPCSRCLTTTSSPSVAATTKITKVATLSDQGDTCSDSGSKITKVGTTSGTGGLCSQSLSGTPYIIKRRPLIITKPHLSPEANTQTSTCHQLITSSRQSFSDRPSKTLQRTTSTPNLNKLTKAKVIRSTSKVDIKGK